MTDNSDNYHIIGHIDYSQIDEVLNDQDGDGVEPLFTPSKVRSVKAFKVGEVGEEDRLDLALGEFGADSSDTSDGGLSGVWT